MSKSKIEYNSEGSDVDDVHISNDLPSLVVFGETISPIARTNFNESLAMKSSNATEKSNSDRKLRRDPNRISYVSTRCEPVLPVSNYGPQSSLVSQKSSRNSSINIARTYNPRTLVSRCCCCCWRHGCRCCCRWNLSRFGKERFDRRNIEQNFHLQNKVSKTNNFSRFSIVIFFKICSVTILETRDERKRKKRKSNICKITRLNWKCFDKMPSFILLLFVHFKFSN